MREKVEQGGNEIYSWLGIKVMSIPWKWKIDDTS